MPLRESEAIILQTYPLGEGDRLVSFLSRSSGRLRGVAAGARRPKSRFGSTLEQLSHVRIFYFERETRDLVRINQCDLIESFLGAFADYESGVTLSLFSEISEAVLPEREHSDPNFRLLLAAARGVKSTRKTAVPLAYFSLWTVRLGGWLPSLETCSRCGKALNSLGSFAARERSGVVCPQCRLPGMRPVSAAARALAGQILSGRLEALLEESHSESAACELTNYLLDIIEHQIERRLRTRSMLEMTA